MNRQQFFILMWLGLVLIASSCRPIPSSVPDVLRTSTYSVTSTAVTIPSLTPSPSSTPIITLTPASTRTPPPTRTLTLSISPTSIPPGELIKLDNLNQVQILETWKFSQTYLAHGPFIAWAPDSVRFAVLVPDKILEYKVGMHSASDKVEFLGIVAGLAYTPDGKVLLTSSHGSLIEYSDRVKQEIQKPPCGGYGDIAVSPAGNFIVTKSRQDSDLYLSLWAYPDYACIGNLFQDYASGFLNMAFSPDSQFFATLAGSSLKIWNVGTQQIVCEINGYGGIVAFSPAGLLGVGSGEDFSVWDPNTCQIVIGLENLFGKNESIQAFNWSPDGSMLIFANFAGPNLVRLHFWDVAIGEMKTMWEINSEIIDQVVFSPNGHYFLTSSQEVDREAPARVTLWGIK